MTESELLANSGLLHSGSEPEADPALAALLGMLDGSASSDPLAILRSQLQTRSQTDPRMALILRSLEQRQANQEKTGALDGIEATDTERDPLEDFAQPASSVEDAPTLDDHIQSAYSELVKMQIRNDKLAAALGACHVCFGEDRECGACVGKGTPGFLPPEPAAYKQYVVPAVHRVKEIQAKRGGRSPPIEKSSEQVSFPH